MGRFFWVNLNAKNNQEKILMEEGTRFENKSAIYTMGSDGKLSIFDKDNKEYTTNNTIQLTDYQYQTFQAVMNNSKDEKKVNALSNKDIELALEMHSQGKLGQDLSEFLGGNYEVENPRRFNSENKFSAYITNGIKKFSAVLSFQYNVKDTKEVVPKQEVEQAAPVREEAPAVAPKGAFTGDNLFKNPSIIVKKSCSHKIQKGEDLVSLARKYEIDTYQLIAANPQLKENKDYSVVYPKNGLAVIKSDLRVGQNIVIPARYSVKQGSCKNLKDVARITGVSESYLKDFLTKIEVENQDGKPDLTAYLDDGGTPTIGYGHTGRFKGKPISCKKGKETKITQEEALELLAEDLLKHKAMTMAYLGEQNYRKAPTSVQNAILDVAYNKGIWDGYMTPNGYAAQTKKIKKDLQQGHYASALVHTRREKTGYRGLRKRNIYRFISGLTDMTQQQRDKAMKAMKPYYVSVLNQCKAYDKPALQKAWENAERGQTTNYTLK